MSDVTMNISIYDSEIKDIEGVLNVLNRKVGTATNLQGFQDEIVDRFSKIGFVVDVLWYSTTVDGTYIPEIVIKDRVDAGFQWDPDRMVHEVTNNILELPGQDGVIKTTKESFNPDHGH